MSGGIKKEPVPRSRLRLLQQEARTVARFACAVDAEFCGRVSTDTLPFGSILRIRREPQSDPNGAQNHWAGPVKLVFPFEYTKVSLALPQGT